MEITRFLPEEAKYIGATEVSDFCRVYVWHHTHTLPELAAIAQALNIAPLYSESFDGGEKRKTERISVEIMLRSLLSPTLQPRHDANGRPFLSNPPFFPLEISISHTHHIYIVSISQQRHGIDAEAWGESAWRLRHKFLSESEQRILQSTNKLQQALRLTPQQMATALWSAKEAAYKAFSSAQLTNVCQIALSLHADGTLWASIPQRCAEVPVSVVKLQECILTLCKGS